MPCSQGRFSNHCELIDGPISRPIRNEHQLENQSKAKEDYTYCHKDTMVCDKGQCSLSACFHYHGTLEACECEVDEATGKS